MANTLVRTTVYLYKEINDAVNECLAVKSLSLSEWIRERQVEYLKQELESLKQTQIANQKTIKE